MLKKFVFTVLFFILIYTRLTNLNWGLPYPMHPDERNMANALQNLKCEILNSKSQAPNINNLRSKIYDLTSNCFNPHFFAYGQFPLYLGYLLIQIYKLITNSIGSSITFVEAVMSLRIISAVTSIINVFILLKIIKLIVSVNNPKIKNSVSTLILPFAFCLFTFSPYFIQFSHFSTTESLLMLLYSLIIYLSLKTINDKILNTKYLILTSLILGLALATKVSSVIFLAVPFVALILNIKYHRRERSRPFPTLIKNFLRFVLCTLIFALIFSPHNIINFNDFLSSMRYESGVALGRYVAFYTRQFVDTVPVIFQMTKIFSYVLGWPQYIFAILGFFFLPWRNPRDAKLINFLRFTFLIYFIPNAFVFAKWTRFMAPVFPVLSLFAVLFFLKLLKKVQNKFNISNYFLLVLIITIASIPGLAYLSIYQFPDVRFQASDWIYKNIPNNSYILSETANVVDLPIETQNLNYVSFNFYDLDENSELQNKLPQLIKKADYIFVPSRRIWANHTRQKYPLLNKYYDDLFSGRLGFQLVAEFTSYPKVSLFGKTLIEFPDENAEETWTVFDHPVIRIYKKNSKSSSYVKTTEDKQFSNYQTILYTLYSIPYTLLIADTPEKWEKGLMFVNNKKDIGGADGMVFIFPKKERLTFWNKNTFVDLDLYWLNDDKVVGKTSLLSIEKSKEIITVDSLKEVNKVIEIIH